MTIFISCTFYNSFLIFTVFNENYLEVPKRKLTNLEFLIEL